MKTHAGVPAQQIALAGPEPAYLSTIFSEMRRTMANEPKAVPSSGGAAISETSQVGGKVRRVALPAILGESEHCCAKDDEKQCEFARWDRDRPLPSSGWLPPIGALAEPCQLLSGPQGKAAF